MWQLIDIVTTQEVSTYNDWYAGNTLAYDYKVTVVSGSASDDKGEFESGEDSEGGSVVTSVSIDNDVWTFIPRSRSLDLTLELPVLDASHNKMIQQESFETLGSARKLIIRGFVLGDEGSITCVWKNEQVPSPGDSQVTYNETVIGRRFLNHITSNKGPHILKSPFGEVWDVQFEGPQISWAPGGILQATISWVETGVQRGGSI